MRGRSSPQSGQTVTALKHRHHAGPRVVVGDFEHDLGEVGEIGVGQCELAERISQLQERAREAGRDEIPVSGFAAPRDPDTVHRLEEIGFHRLFWYVPPEPRDQVAERIERYAERARELAAA